MTIFPKGRFKMYSIGDVVTYAASGVCRVSGYTENKVKGVVKKYVVLTPFYESNSTIYVPQDNEVLMGRIKNVLTKEEIDTLIRSMPDIDCSWIDNDLKRADYFRTTLKSGDREAIMRMVRVLYVHRKSQIESGKKFHSSDERYLKEAEHILFDEFAVVLGIEPDEVVDFITERLEKIS